MSTEKDFCQLSAESPTASALTLQTRASRPPSAFAPAATQAVSAGPSATSRAWPNAFTPLALSAATVASTSAALRAQIDTLAPSAAKPSAMARPIPLLPPVTATFLPFNPRSMIGLLRPHLPSESWGKQQYYVVATCLRKPEPRCNALLSPGRRRFTSVLAGVDFNHADRTASPQDRRPRHRRRRALAERRSVAHALPDLARQRRDGGARPDAHQGRISGLLAPLRPAEAAS